MIIAIVSKVHLLVVLSNFEGCWVTRESVLWGSSALKATTTTQNLKIPLMDEIFKLELLSLHQIFRPIVTLYSNLLGFKIKFMSHMYLLC